MGPRRTDALRTRQCGSPSATGPRPAGEDGERPSTPTSRYPRRPGRQVSGRHRPPRPALGSCDSRPRPRPPGSGRRSFAPARGVAVQPPPGSPRVPPSAQAAAVTPAGPRANGGGGGADQSRSGTCHPGGKQKPSEDERARPPRCAAPSPRPPRGRERLPRPPAARLPEGGRASRSSPRGFPGRARPGARLPSWPAA